MNKTSGLTIDETREAGACIVALTGRIDSGNAEAVSKRLLSLIGAGEKTIVLDLAQVPYLTSAAFRALLIAAREAERGAVKFALCGVSGHVRDLFEMGGLLAVFAIHASRQEAVAHNAAGE